MAFSADGPNLLWSHPQLSDTNLLKNAPDQLTGGFGGDRLWFSPELAFHWEGKPDWKSFANYRAPPDTDPGNYQFTQNDLRSIHLRAAGRLPVKGSDQQVGFEVTRTIRMTSSPVAKNDPMMHGVDYVGIESLHRLKLSDTTRSGSIDLWHLLQMPAGSVLIVPIRKTADRRLAKPLSYGLPGGWVVKADHVMWRYGGEAHAKLGLPATVLTGRSAVLRQLGSDRWCLIVRQFPVDPAATYADHPYGVERKDQVFQAWDGYGFGEMEYHSPMLDARSGPRELQESDQLWAFGGRAQAIAALGSRLLEVDIGYLINR
jgi:hypothetical protein